MSSINFEAYVLHTSKIDNKVAQLSKMGWELISISSKDQFNKKICLFKRELTTNWRFK